MDGIPFLRTGRDELTGRVRRLLAAGDEAAARIALLADADDWWGEDPPPPEQLARVVDASTLREAMDLLGLGRVGDYFAYRWSDPTYLAGLALLQQHWPGDRPVVDVACGTGHLLRELSRRGCTDLLGVDVVWAKLWLAQRFVCPAARYVCADVTAPDIADVTAPGIADVTAPGIADLTAHDVAAGGAAAPDVGVARPAYVLCHDALYFLRDKPAAVAGMRALAGDAGTVVVGHTHVADTLSSGEPLRAAGYADLLGTDLLYDDEELTRALLDGRPPRPAAARDLERSEAIALVAGDPRRPAPHDLGEPLGPLRANPLYVAGQLRWPSERYEQEYAARSSYLPASWPDPLPPGAARRRLLVDLPEAW